MMMLGQAAGTAAALFEADMPWTDASMERLRTQLATDGVALNLQEGWLDAMPDLEPVDPELVDPGDPRSATDQVYRRPRLP